MNLFPYLSLILTSVVSEYVFGGFSLPVELNDKSLKEYLKERGGYAIRGPVGAERSRGRGWPQGGPPGRQTRPGGPPGGIPGRKGEGPDGSSGASSGEGPGEFSGLPPSGGPNGFPGLPPSGSPNGFPRGYPRGGQGWFPAGRFPGGPYYGAGSGWYRDNRFSPGWFNINTLPFPNDNTFLGPPPFNTYFSNQTFFGPPAPSG